MANGKIRFGKQSGGELALVIPDGVTNTEVIVPESGMLATKQYVDDVIGEYGGAGGLSIEDKTKLDEIEDGATADQSAEEIKIAYESNANTNALTDPLLTLLTTNKVKNVTTDAFNSKLVITYTDGTTSELNVNDIVTDVYVSGATLDATTNVLTLTSTSGGADVTVNLSDFVNSSELTSALATKPDIDDNTPSTTNTYSSQHTQDLHNVQATAIANLATAQAQILNDDTTVITTTNQPLSFSVNIDSTDTNVMTLNATNDTFTFLKNASYNFTSAIQLASSTGQTRTITFEVIDVSDNSVLATQTATLDVASGSDIIVNTVTLLTIGKNAFPNAPVTASIRVRASGTGYTINGFTSILASSSSYDVSADASSITNTPAGNIAATTVQAAINELDTEKASTSHNHTGIYEPADATILKDVDIGSTVQGYNANTTTAGNTFNGANQLVQLNGTGGLPAIDGSQLTNMPVALPSQTGFAGKYLKTDGTNASWETAQEVLVSGTNIKTINSSSILGSGNLALLDATNPSITGSITEQVYNLTGTVINPANGTIQYKTITANTTFTETLASGQSVLLRLIGANGKTITFPTITWVGAAAPTLTANCAIVLWKEQSVLYGAFVGTLV